MMLLEHDSKCLLAEAGLPIPDGVLLRSADDLPPFGSGVAKAQVPVGGRGKAGGIRRFASMVELTNAVDMFDLQIAGHRVRAIRVEAAVDQCAEAYVSVAINPSLGKVTVMLSSAGGIHVEEVAGSSGMAREDVTLGAGALKSAVRKLAGTIAGPVGQALTDAGLLLVDLFLARELMLVEINPLFVHADGSWTAGDAKIVVDDNAFDRQPSLLAIIGRNPDLYPEAAMKLAQGFDYVDLDFDGDIGLITTGAGLSMQIVDELIARGRRPFNFCDIRTGQFRGDPVRLVQVMRWLSDGPNIRGVLINFFAGHTHLGEVARLLVAALAEVPELDVPIVARLIGNGFEEAIEALAGVGGRLRIETNLDRAMDCVASIHG